jgi:hypothetical protein
VEKKKTMKNGSRHSSPAHTVVVILVSVHGNFMFQSKIISKGWCNIISLNWNSWAFELEDVYQDLVYVKDPRHYVCPSIL